MAEFSSSTIPHSSEHPKTKIIQNERSAQPDLIKVCEDAVSRCSAEAIYSQYPHDFKADNTGKLRGRPPFRDSKSGTSFTVFPDKGFFDAGDNFGGSPIDYIHSMRVGRWERAKGKDWVNALKELCQLAGVEFPESNYQPDDIEAHRRWFTRQEVLRHTYEYCHQVLFNPVLLKSVQALDYLHERKINDDTISNLQIGFYDSWVNLSNYLISKGFTPEEIKKTGLQRGVFMTDDGVKISETKCSWENFITIPWLDEQGKPLTLYGRYYQKKPENPNTPKTLALPGKGTKKVPFLFHIVKQNNHREVVSVEGLFDAIALYQEGMTNVCSPIAASFSNQQIDCLVRNRIERVTHLGDPDGGGDGGTKSNLERLTKKKISVYVPERLPDGLDPDEYLAQYGIDHLNERIKNAAHGLRWLARLLLSLADLTNDKGLEELFKQCALVRKKYLDVDDTIWEVYFVQEILNSLNMDVETFRLNLETAFAGTETEDRENHGNLLRDIDQSAIAKSIAEKYRDNLAYDLSIDQWRRYEAEIKGVWSIENKICVKHIVEIELNLIKTRTSFHDKITDNLVNGVTNLLKGHLSVRKWDLQDKNLLPLSNGVLNLKTRELAPHSPAFRLTWSLPYHYNPLFICTPIIDWLHEMLDGKQDLVQLVRAYLKAIVTSRTDLQKYLELIGPGGTGKSTLIRLAIALIGVNNVHTTTLDSLENNRFETASIKDKRLVVITDSERYGGAVSRLKALTGQDGLPYEVKFKQSTGGFIPDAMVILAANEQIQSSDYTSGLQRRRLTLPMTLKIPSRSQRNLLTINDSGITGEFVQYIPGLLNWVLGMNDEDMVRVIKDETFTPSLSEAAKLTLIDTNPLADWADHRVIYEVNAKTYVGNKSGNPERLLYPSYCKFCEDSGYKPIALRRFSNLLSDLFNNQLNLPVSKYRDCAGWHFMNIRLRADSWDTDIPPAVLGKFFHDDSPDDSPNDCRDVCNTPDSNTTRQETTQLRMSSISSPDVGKNEGKMKAEPLGSVQSEGNVGKNEPLIARSTKKVEKKNDSKNNNLSDFTYIPTSHIQGNSSSLHTEPTSSNILPTQNEHPETECSTQGSKFQVGDRVKFQVGNFWFDGTVKKVLPNREYICEWSDTGGLTHPPRKEHQIRKYP